MAKIAGVEMCRAYHEQYGCRFISVMPTNLYGPGDNYDLENAHVLPALLRKFHEAKLKNDPSVNVWGTGNPRREFLPVDDAAVTIEVEPVVFDSTAGAARSTIKLEAEPALSEGGLDQATYGPPPTGG